MRRVFTANVKKSTPYHFHRVKNVSRNRIYLYLRLFCGGSMWYQTWTRHLHSCFSAAAVGLQPPMHTLFGLVTHFSETLRDVPTQPRSQGLSSYRPLLVRSRGRQDERPWERGWCPHSVCITVGYRSLQLVLGFHGTRACSQFRYKHWL